MNIAFNALDCGLGNNGGSRTILHCARVLNLLGHPTDIIATADRFTWFEHTRCRPDIPKGTDWVIATACTSVPSTMKHNHSKKAWYIRAHETWNPKYNTEKSLMKLYRTPHMLPIVNSIWLKELLQSYDIKCHLIYQGLDLHMWYDTRIREHNKKIVIGCLYTSQPRKQWGLFKVLHTVLGDRNYKFISYGTSDIPDTDKDFISHHYIQPNTDELRKIYSMCDIWFAPTNSEGLHNPPMEAMMCGAIVCCSNTERNGMKDYAIPDKTAIVYDDNNIAEAGKMVQEFESNYYSSGYNKMRNRAQTIIMDTIGTREHNMKKLVKLLESQ